MGRDLALKPQRGALLNYLIYPYAELDGAPIAQDKIKSSFAYHEYRRANKSPRGSSGNHSHYRDRARTCAKSVSDCTLAGNFLLTLMGVAHGGAAGSVPSESFCAR